MRTRPTKFELVRNNVRSGFTLGGGAYLAGYLTTLVFGAIGALIADRSGEPADDEQQQTGERLQWRSL